MMSVLIPVIRLNTRFRAPCLAAGPDSSLIVFLRSRKIIIKLWSDSSRDLVEKIYKSKSLLLKLVVNNSVAEQKLDVSLLYDRLETQLRTLESLGITSNKSAAMIFPLIESCLPEKLIRVWKRSSYSKMDSGDFSTEGLNSGESTLKVRLKNLM